MNSNMPLLVLFDCDGTLVDSQHMIVAAMHGAYAMNGRVPPMRERILSIVGLSLPEAFTNLSEGEEGYPVMAMAEAYRTSFMQLRDSNPPEPMFPNAREVLSALRERHNVQLGMVTGKARRGVDRVLSEHDMVGWFETIQTADDAPSKPHPGMVLQAMQELGASPEQTIVVGDTSFDMAMARSARAGALGVSWGYHPNEDLHNAGAHLLVDHFTDIPDALAHIASELQRSIKG